jgi:hypothetical protein
VTISFVIFAVAMTAYSTFCTSLFELQFKVAKVNPFVFQPFGKENDDGYDIPMEDQKVAAASHKGDRGRGVANNGEFNSRAELFASAPTVSD